MDAFGVSAEAAQHLLDLASAQGRPDSIEAAAAIYYDERRHLLLLLSHLLQVFLEYYPVNDQSVTQHITKLLRALVSSDASETSLLSRLCDIAQVCSSPHLRF